MSDLIFQTVVTAALLHDIGKFFQRGDFGQLTPAGKHPAISRDFINAHRQFFARFCDLDLLAELAARHHESGRFPAELQVAYADESIRHYAYMISRADNYSSAERDDSITASPGNYKKTGLVSVFSRLELDAPASEEYSYKLQRLRPEVAFPIPGRAVIDETPYKKHLKEFGEEFNRLTQDRSIASFDHFYTKLLGILHSYTWCVPGSTLDSVPDVSLFDHLKTTSAIAAALYRYHEEFPRGVTVDSIEKFRLLAGDLSGIQKYIFRATVKGYGRIAKRLRARSFFLGMITDIVSHMILHSFRLPLANLLMVSGGKFYILLPNTSQAGALLLKIQRQVDGELFERFQGELALNIASIPLSGDDFNDFGTVMNQLGRSLAARKHRAFSQVLQSAQGWNSEEFVRKSAGGLDVCPACGKVHPDQGPCDECLRDELLGTKLPKTTHIAFFTDNPAAIPVIAGYGFTLDKGAIVHNKTPYLVYNLNEKGKPSGYPEAVKYIAKHVPAAGDQSLNFDEIVQKANGHKLLGCLKADVDNLGMHFSFGLREDTHNHVSISRISTLSRMLELFFSGWMEEILSSKYQNCYTVYSGGDDLLIIGPWNETLELAEEVNDRFHAFTACNPNITMSAGAALFKPRFPIDNAVEQTEHLLELSKETAHPVTGQNRNQITTLGKTMNWTEYRTMMQEAGRLAGWLAEKQITGALLYRLQHYSAMYMRATGGGDKNKNSGFMSMPLLYYDIGRNGRGLQREISDWLFKLAESPEQLMPLMKPITVYALYKNRGGTE